MKLHFLFAFVLFCSMAACTSNETLAPPLRAAMYNMLLAASKPPNPF